MTEERHAMCQDNQGEKPERCQFFISSIGQDKPLAAWIAAQFDTADDTLRASRPGESSRRTSHSLVNKCRSCLPHTLGYPIPSLFVEITKRNAS